MLGLVISSGVKVLVLAVIVGIGSTIFSEFTAGFAGEHTINDAMSVVLGALALLALGIFGPLHGHGPRVRSSAENGIEGEPQETRPIEATGYRSGISI